jgi:hypothetical protein
MKKKNTMASLLILNRTKKRGIVEYLIFAGCIIHSFTHPCQQHSNLGQVGYDLIQSPNQPGKPATCFVYFNYKYKKYWALGKGLKPKE